MTEERESGESGEAGIGAARVAWGILWRSVVWYTAAGAVLGAFYGCAFLAAALLLVGAGGADESHSVWIMRSTVAFGGLAGLAAGWMLARRIEQMPTSLGAVAGLLVGLPLGGFYFVFMYIFAFPIGAIVGAAYGFAVGVVNAVTVAFITLVFFPPTSDPHSRSRAVTAASVLGAAAIPGAWLIVFSEHGVGGQHESAVFVGLVYAGFPAFILALTGWWIGGRIPLRNAHESDR